MKGIVYKTGVHSTNNKPYVFIKGEDGKEYYTDGRYLATGTYIRQLDINKYVKFVPLEKNGKRTAVEVECLSIEVSKELIEKIGKKFNDIIEYDGWLDASPSSIDRIFKSIGIEDYKIYLVNVEDFINKYFNDQYYLKKNFAIENRVVPCVIVNQDKVIEYNLTGTIENNKYNRSSSIQFEDLCKLKELHECGSYIELLTCPEFLKYEAKDICLDLELFNIIIDAADHVLKRDSKGYIINLFQEELAVTKETKNIIKKWKKNKNRRFSKEIMESFAQVSIFKLDSVIEAQEIYNQITSLLGETKPNDTFTALSSRYIKCWNEIVPHLFLIRVLRASTEKVFKECVREYCEFLKSVKKQRDLYRKIDANSLMNEFVEFIKAVKNNASYSLEREDRIKCLSVLLEHNQKQKIIENANILLACGNPEEAFFLKLLNEAEKVTEEDFKEAFSAKYSVQIIEKCVAILWDENWESGVNSNTIINFLSWILIYGSFSVADDILNYTVNKRFSKKEKSHYLISSLPRIYELIKQERSIFILACYITTNVVPQWKNVEFDDSINDAIKSWSRVSDEFFALQIEKLDGRCDDIKNVFTELLSIFTLDPNHLDRLQDIYIDKLLDAYREVNSENIPGFLLELNEQKAYKATIHFYELFNSLEKIADENVIKLYIEALSCQNQYDKGFRLLLDYNYLDKKLIAKLLIYLVGQLFYYHGISSESIEILRNSISIGQAIDLFERFFDSNQSSVVMPLVALYEINGDRIKALYLLSIYGKEFNTGFSKLKTDLNRRMGAQIQNFDDHYKVIHHAFNVLSPKSIYEFVNWTTIIPVKFSAGYRPVHIFSFLYDELLLAPYSEETWKAFAKFFVEGFTRHKNKISEELSNYDQWMSCICLTILMSEFNAPSSSQIAAYYKSAFKKTDLLELPKNFLHCITEYIVLSKNVELCHDLSSFIEKNATMNQRFDSTWMSTDRNAFEDFISFCKEIAGDVYYRLVRYFDIDLSDEEILDYALYSSNKQIVIRALAKKVLNNENASVLLSSDIWTNLTYQEKEAYNLLLMLHEDSSIILEDYPEIFSDESDVEQFKQNCANVLLSYPDFNAFANFETKNIYLKTKLRDLSFLLGVYYNESIYDKYSKIKYMDLLNKDIDLEYFLFLKKSFEAQVVYNSSYEDFYKCWRYNKLLLVNVYLGESAFNDEFIIELAKTSNQLELISEYKYFDFKNSLCRLISNELFGENELRQFIYALVSGDFGEFLLHSSSSLIKATNEQKSDIRQLVKMVNYRAINASFYQTYKDNIKRKEFDLVGEIAYTVSLFAFDSIQALKRSENLDNDIAFYCKCAASNNSPGYITKYIIEECLAKKGNIDLYVSVLCSRQLPFKIMNTIRRSILGNKINELNNIYMICRYLSKNGVEDAENYELYFTSLKYCIDGNVGELRRLLASSDITKGISNDWLEEANAILEYSLTNGGEKFVAGNIAVTANGFIGSSKKIFFIEKIREFVDVDNSKEQNNLSLSIIRNKLRELNTPDMEDNYEGYVTELGLLSASLESPLPIDLKLSILLELYSHRWCSDDVFNVFNSIHRDFSIELWIDNYKEIVQLVNTTGNLNFGKEVSYICEGILKACPRILYPSECSRETIVQEFDNKVYPGKSEYARSIENALRRKIEEILNGTRLNISIENNESFENGCVYFCVENIGKTIANLKKKEHRILLTVITPDKTEFEIDPLRNEVKNVLELRPGWLTGFEQLIPVELIDNYEWLLCKVSIFEKNELLCADSKRLETKTLKLLSTTPKKDAYFIDEQLFGREEEKTQLREAIENKGTFVIYGPSRIGKTSILNWIKYTLSSEYSSNTGKQIITVSMGDERGVGKDNDYVNYFYSKTPFSDPLPYHESPKIAEYVLIDSIYEGINKASRRATTHNCDAIVSGIRSILENSRTESLGEQYELLNHYLRENKCEIWLCLDEFQQVLENLAKSSSPAPMEFVDVCSRIRGGMSCIKIFFCGSDELLRQMVLETDNSIWREKILEKAERVQVGPIKKPSNETKQSDAFKDMIRNNTYIKEVGIDYSNEALNAVCVYTDRVPLYGKMICNTVVDLIRSTTPEKFGRVRIYSYDISCATQALLQTQKIGIEGKRDNRYKTDRIVETYDAVTKGFDIEKQYLWCMGAWFNKHPAENVFPYSEFLPKENEQWVDNLPNLDNFLLLVGEKGRGIIRETLCSDGNIGYVFSNLFYHNAFCGMSYNFEPTKIISKISDEINDNEGWSFETQTIETVVSALRARRYSEDDLGVIRKGLKNILGDSTTNVVQNIQNQYNDNAIDQSTQNNIVINAQIISTTINTLLSGDVDAAGFIEAIGKMPTIRSYCGEKLDLLDDQIAKKKSLAQADPELKDVIEAQIEEKLAEKEIVSEQAADKIVSDTMASVTFEDLMKVDVERKRELLGLDKTFDMKLLDDLDEAYKTPLLFAISLHNIFDRIYSKEISTSAESSVHDVEKAKKSKDNMDFCPVAIMYCKIVEAMLKKTHTKLYVRTFPEATLKKGEKVLSNQFKGLEDSTGKIDTENKDLTIGSFSVPIVWTDKENDIDKPDQFFSKPKRNELKAISSSRTENAPLYLEWFAHAKAIAIIGAIRNKAAHEAKRITKTNFDWLLDELFKKGEFLRILKLSGK